MQSSLCQSLHEIRMHPPNGSCVLHIQDTFRVPPYGFKTTNEIISYCMEDQEANIISKALFHSAYSSLGSSTPGVGVRLPACFRAALLKKPQYPHSSAQSLKLWWGLADSCSSPGNSRETLLRCSVPQLVLELISYLFSGEGPQLSS